jgi:glycosyltransferase involved in cell wall biosynthesis
MNTIAIAPDLSQSFGGPQVFQCRLRQALEERGIAVHYGLRGDVDAALLINASRDAYGLLRTVLRRAPIVQRLGGSNFMHRHQHATLRYYLRCEARNAVMRFVRNHVAHEVVYQSEFARKWWLRFGGKERVKTRVIYNGVDLSLFKPASLPASPVIRMLSVEGTLGTDPGGTALQLVRELRRRGYDVVLDLVGRANAEAVALWNREKFVRYHGIVENSDLPRFYQQAHLFVATDVIAACPNTVLEALACGTPVVGFESGALPELLNSEAGYCVAFPGNAWRAEPPQNVTALADAALAVLAEQQKYREGARALAQVRYGLTQMAESYLAVFEEAIASSKGEKRR